MRHDAGRAPGSSHARRGRTAQPRAAAHPAPTAGIALLNLKRLINLRWCRRHVDDDAGPDGAAAGQLARSNSDSGWASGQPMSAGGPRGRDHVEIAPAGQRGPRFVLPAIALTGTMSRQAFPSSGVSGPTIGATTGASASRSVDALRRVPPRGGGRRGPCPGPAGRVAA